MAGAGYKLFNTGDVLTAAQVNTYLQEQAVMRFANATARTTALSGVLSEGMMSYLDDTNSVEVYNGSSWVNVANSGDITGVTAGTGISGGGTSGDVTITNSMATAIDAKGDLVAGTADDTFARLAVGNNGETLVADSSTATGLRWSAAPTMGNPVINSGMDVWQRGTSVSASGSQFGADRWNSYRDGYAAGITVSRQNTSDTTNLPQIQYCSRIQRNSGNTSTAGLAINYNFENVDSTQFIGKTVTLSFYARKGANFSAASNGMAYSLVSGTGTDQSQRDGFTGQSNVINTTATLTDTWQRFSATGTVSTSAKQLAINFYYTPTGTAGANDYYEFTGVQLDVGSVALPYRRYSATLAGELAACQKYFETSYNSGTTPGDGAQGSSFQLTGVAITTGQVRAPIFYKVPKRAAATVTFYRTSTGASAGMWTYYNGGNIDFTGMGYDGNQIGFYIQATKTSSFTANNAYAVYGDWIASAEL